MKLILLMSTCALLTAVQLQSADSNPLGMLYNFRTGTWSAESSKPAAGYAEKRAAESLRSLLAPEIVKELAGNKSAKIIPVLKRSAELVFSTESNEALLRCFTTPVAAKNIYKGTDLTGTTLYVVGIAELGALTKDAYKLVSLGALCNKRAPKPDPFVEQHCRFQAAHIAENWAAIKSVLKAANIKPKS